MTIQSKIVFIGGGNMASAIVEGMLSNYYVATSIYVVDRNQSKRDFFQKLGVHVAASTSELLSDAEVVVLAVKPQNAQELCLELKPKLAQKSPLILSVLAGVTTDTLAQLLGDHLAIVRAMPNTPAKVGAGATGLFANKHVQPAQKQQADAIMASVGLVAWLTKEDQLTAINALSGSGPAYYFYFMELMQQIGEEMGLSADIAKSFALQTAYGAAKLALETQDDFAALRAQVTSKGGTTAAALAVMHDQDLRSIFKSALEACAKRAVELSKF